MAIQASIALYYNDFLKFHPFLSRENILEGRQESL